MSVQSSPVQSSPYNYQKSHNFWRTGVANVKLGNELFESIHNLHFSDSTRISSVGSCFAQNVGAWLLKNDYNFNKSLLDQTQLSSFAFGNIYTPRSLLQWLRLDDLDLKFSTFSDSKSGKLIYYDLLRPLYKKSGFNSLKSLLDSREEATFEMRANIAKTDVLIFSLGLTEAWKDINGIVYPNCPGVIAGEFNGSIYKLINFSYEQIRKDLEEVLSYLKKLNSTIKIVLTISPVPLTATATNKHVLLANQYSKSTFRSVAGFLSDTYPDFLYFPSYELFTIHNSDDFRFHENKRTVTKCSVEYVMEHFSKAFYGNKSYRENVIKDKCSIIAQSSEVVCNEEFLDAIKKTDKEKLSKPSQLVLVGDSHMGKLSKALDYLKVDYCGGMVMNGSGFSDKKFVACDKEYFVPLESPESRKIWLNILDNLNECEKQRISPIIISNITMQTHINIVDFLKWSSNRKNISIIDIVKYIKERQIEQLTILIKLSSLNGKVILVSDPPFSRDFPESKNISKVIFAYFNAMQNLIRVNNLELYFFNAAEKFVKEGHDSENYRSKVRYSNGSSDWYHGNDNYYTWLANSLISEYL